MYGMKKKVSILLGKLLSKMFLRHLLVGAFMYTITVAALHLFLSILRWETLISLVILQSGLFIFGFVFARRFIFKEKNVSFKLNPVEQAKRYAVLLFFFRFLDIVFSFIMIDLLEVSYVVVPLIVTNIIFVVKFFVYRKFVFCLAKDE